ncbi:MAG: hypothetical protein JW984_14410 [Deltaproteobacteria bacterium]|uniref:Uncharacterized protein n=1 Tax=Candidatus Zymogenus saltonus TaxID=2844893 RepID=A0A9D8KGR1_9DELT|nr:hypothetical protein [Candidatus Zymogenus saltonus]
MATIRTFLSKQKRLTLKIVGKSLDIMRLPGDAKIGRLAQSDLSLKIDTERLLLKQVNDKGYRMTEPMLRVVVEYLAVDELFGGNNRGVNLFNNLRIGLKSKFPEEERGTIKALRDLSQKVSKNGFSPYDFVIIDKNQKILFGHDLLANALYFGIGEIPVKIALTPLMKLVGKRENLTIQDNRIQRDKGGIQEKFFSDEEIDLIEATMDKIFFDLGLYFPGILWGPVSEYFDTIMEKLSKRHKVVFVKDYRFDDKDDFYEMLKRLYSWEAVKEDYIKMKFDYLIKHPLIIRFFSLLILNPGFKSSDGGNKPFSSVVKNMKEDYRRIYSMKVENYIRDVVLHIGDNFQHNRHILNVIGGIGKSGM